MTSNRIIRSFTLCAIVMLLLAACSIFDDYPHRRQYDVILRVTDSTGQVLPDSVASVKTLYAFRNGIFYGKYMAEEDGVIRITYEDRDSMTFVAMTSDLNNLCEITEPEIGESIHNVWLQLKTQGDCLASDLSGIFYGNLTTLIYAGGQQEQKKTISLQDQRARVRVYVRALRPNHGSGNYRVVLQGLHSGITYNGEPGGKAVNCSLSGKFVNLNDWCTQSATVLPTGKEPCRLLIYKQDGTLIFDTCEDENGKPLLIHPQDDIVFFVTVDYLKGISVKVLPFEELDNYYTFG